MPLIPKSTRERWRGLLAKATPGPWQWFGNMKMREVYLATVDRGRVFVMDFERWGMSGAQPRFQVRLDGNPGSGIMRRLDEMGDLGPKMVGSHRNDFVGIDHPDASLIASAPTAMSALLDENERLRAMVTEACGIAGVTAIELRACYAELGEEYDTGDDNRISELTREVSDE